MAWTSLTFAFGSLLTSAKMTQLYDNITALANGDSGAPEIIQAALEAGAIHQGELDTSLGEVSALSGAAGNKTLAGGSYGFYPQIKAGDTFDDIDSVTISGAYANPGTTYLTNIYLDPAAGHDVLAQQCYINSSPPIDLGDGDVPLFVFLEVDPATGLVVGTYAADVPPWLYNGPTITTPNYKGGDRTKKMRREVRIDPATGEPREVIYEVTMDVKNADMELIRHPFPGTARKVVLLDPPATEKLKALHDAGESTALLFKKEYVLFDNSPLNRKAPPGVMPVSFRWKNTGGR